ncbi:MAG: hypothetical protein ACJ76V_06515, partial [Thermoleophilaceae bacterium]
MADAVEWACDDAALTGRPSELWAIDLDGLPIVSDPNDDNAWVISEPVPPEGLVCLGSPPDLRFANDRVKRAAGKPWAWG